ncbi:MBL fold metallo-hydrolase [Clavibacter tessellarius]|uniref:MBL fold metallo-hydrolase n=1 Tax=Clavibacter tessellarius TaxID=31965 RepID=UPI0032503C04
MYDIDFLAVENEERNGTKSGDAIIVSLPDAVDGVQKLVVVDAGFTDTGQQVIDNISRWYGAVPIDLIISTHPDSDHLNGLQSVLEAFEVRESHDAPSVESQFVSQ